MYVDNEDTTIKWLIDSKGRPLVNRQSFAPNYITSGFSLHEWCVYEDFKKLGEMSGWKHNTYLFFGVKYKNNGHALHMIQL